MTTLDQRRHAEQSALLASGDPLVFGRARWTRLPADLAAAAADEAHPAWLDGGLTARVRRVERPGGAVALKKARAECLVRNEDGRLSFVNELLRRRELEALAAAGRAVDGVVPTLYGSLAEGVIVSPWIDGRPVAQWDERRLRQVYATGAALVEAGFFEWDFSPGNVLDDGARIWLFDFGYMFRFDPLTQINTAGSGVEHPQFHLAERIETRNLFGQLLTLEQTAGPAAALQLFRVAKTAALETYATLRTRLAVRGATPLVLGHLDLLIGRWRAALAGDLGTLYLAEGWRSHEADLDDDLRGRTCTPMTLQRARWLIARAGADWAALQAAGALPAGRTRADLLAELHERLEEAAKWQLRPGRAAA